MKVGGFLNPIFGMGVPSKYRQNPQIVKSIKRERDNIMPGLINSINRKRLITFFLIEAMVLSILLAGIPFYLPDAAADVSHDVGNLDINMLTDYGRISGPLSWVTPQTVVDFSGIGFIGLVIDQDNYEHTPGFEDIADPYLFYPYDMPDDLMPMEPIEWAINDGSTQKSTASYLNMGTMDPGDILIHQTVWTVAEKDWAILQWTVTNIKGIDLTGVSIGLEIPLSQMGAGFGLGGDSGDDIDGYDATNEAYWASDDDFTTIGFASAIYSDPLTHYFSMDYHVDYDTFCHFYEDDTWLYNRIRAPNIVEGAIPGNRTSTVGWNNLDLGIDESRTLALVIAINNTYDGMIFALDDARDYYYNETTSFLITEFSDSDSVIPQIEVYNFGRPATDMIAEGYFLSGDGGTSALSGNWSNNPLPSYEHAVFNVTGGTMGPEGDTIGLYQDVGGNIVLMDDVAYGQEGIAPDPLAGESVGRHCALEYTNYWVRNASSGPTWGYQNDVGDVHPFSPVVLNEVMFNPNAADYYFVELYNKGSTDMDISGYRIVCDREYIIESATILGSDNSHYYLFYNMDSEFFDNATNGINSTGDNVYLYDTNGILLDMVGWSSQHTVNKSVSRVPDGNGTSQGHHDNSSKAAGWRFDQLPSFSLIEINPDMMRHSHQGNTVVYNLTIKNKHDNDDLVDVSNISGPWAWEVITLNESGAPLNDSNGNGIPDIFVPTKGQMDIRIKVTIPMGQSAGDMETTRVKAQSTIYPHFYDHATLRTVVDYLGAFENVTFPTGSYVIPMDDKQNDTLKVFGFMHALLRNGSMIHRIIEPPDMTMRTATFPGGAIYYGGPVLVLPEYESIVTSVIASFPSITMDVLTQNFTSDAAFAVSEPTNILVIYGAWGLTNTVLDEMEIPYTLIQISDAESNSSLIGPPHDLVVVDCVGWAGGAPQNVVDAIRTLVENGGEAMFNCYATQTMIQIFPGYVKGNLVGNHEEYCTFHPISEFPAQYYGPASINFSHIWAEMEAIHPDVRVLWTTDDSAYYAAAIYFPYGKNGGVVEGTIFEPGHQLGGSDSRTFASILYGNKFVHFAPKTDLAISSSDIVFIPSSPVGVNSIITINATIHNIGYINASNVAVRFYDGPPASGNRIGNDRIINQIEGLGGIAYTEISWQAAPADNHNIFVVVDPENLIAESNELNNIASKAIDVIDILPSTLYIEAYGYDVTLNWTQNTKAGLSHYLLYRSTSQTDFDFSKVWVNTSSDSESGEPGPIPLRTMWNDTNACSDSEPREYYYIMRTVFDSGEISHTSRTVGKWTRTFHSGVSTFSLPFEPMEILSTDDLTTQMNADHIKYINKTTHNWMKHEFGDGAANDTQMVLGEGYEVKFTEQTNYTFTGMPGAMIIYDENKGFFGFNSSSEARNLTISIMPNGDVNLTWQQPINMNEGWFEVFYSHNRDGFFGILNEDYFSAVSSVNFGNTQALHVGAQANDPGSRLYYMVVPFNASGMRGTGTYSIGIWTEDYQSGYDTLGIPLKLNYSQTADWYCDKISDTVGMNYYIYGEQRWGWHSKRMQGGAYDTILEMAEGYQISTSSITKFTFVGV